MPKHLGDKSHSLLSAPVSVWEKIDAAIKFYASMETYVAPRTGGVLEGCSRSGVAPIFEDRGRAASDVLMELVKLYPLAETTPSHARPKRCPISFCGFDPENPSYPGAKAEDCGVTDCPMKASAPSTTPRSGAYAWIGEAAEELKEGQRWYHSERAEALLSGVPVPQQDLGFGSPADIAARLIVEAGKWKYRTDSQGLMEAGRLMEEAAQAIVSVASATLRFEEKPRAWLIERPTGTGKQATMEYEVVLSPLTDDTFMDEGDRAWPLFRRADGGKQT